MAFRGKNKRKNKTLNEAKMIMFDKVYMESAFWFYTKHLKTAHEK